MTAHTFTIRSRERGQFLGQAVICAEAKYASVMRTTSPYPARRFPNADQWDALEQELDDALPPSHVAETSAIARLLVGKQPVLVQYLRLEQLPPGTPTDEAVVELDERLRVVRDEGEIPANAGPF